MVTATFDRDFEDAILAASLKSDEFVKRALRICDAHHFGTREQAWIWKAISDTWSKYKERPTPSLIAHKAREDFPDVDKRRPYLKLARKLFKLKPKSPRSALEQLETFVRYVNAQLALEAGAEALERGDVEAAETAMAKASRSKVKERSYTHIRWFEEFDERQAQREYEATHPDEFRIIPMGLPTFDKALGGGARVPEVGLILGTTGRGKSIWLNNIAQATVAREFNACYIGMEMPARQIASRQDSRWLQTSYDKFKQFDFKPAELRTIERTRARWKKKLQNKMHILSFPVRSATIDTIRAALDDLRADWDFKPDVILMDSADHLLAIDRRQDYRLQQAEVYWELKRLAEEDGYVIWSSTHAGKEYATAVATAEAAAESYDKSRIADSIISINDPFAKRKSRKTVEIDMDDIEAGGEVEEIREPETAEPGIRRLEGFLAKYRDGKSMVKVKLDCDFDKMLIKEAGADDEEAKDDAD